MEPAAADQPDAHDAQYELSAAPLALLYVPAAQFTHDDASASAYVPAAQMSHTAAPPVAMYPGAHAVHAAAPVWLSVDVPTGHAVHDDEFDLL